MNIISGFKRNKPRQFSYKPVYFDPEQDERTAREAKNAVGDDYVPGSIVRGMRMERHTTGSDVNSKKMAQDARNRTVIRLMIFLCLLFLVAYIVMNSTMLETMFTVFKGK